MTSLQNKFELLLKNQKMILPGDTVGVACSAGPDSTALAYLISEMKQWNLKIVFLHFHHRLRAGADQDAEFVKKMASKLGVKAVIEKRPMLKLRGKRESLEEAARKWRYDFLCRAAKKNKISKILLAHTLDDQAETVLMRMLQGTGGRGLCGIRERIELNGVMFCRPLLRFTKEELVSWLKKNRIAFRFDSTNRSRKILRNKIRLDLIPYLRKHYNPKVTEALGRIPLILSREEDALNQSADEAWTKTLHSKRRGRVVFDQKKWLLFPEAIQFRLMDRALKSLHPDSGMLAEHWSIVSHRIRQKKYQADLPRHIQLCVEKQKLIFKRSGIH